MRHKFELDNHHYIYRVIQHRCDTLKEVIDHTETKKLCVGKLGLNPLVES